MSLMKNFISCNIHLSSDAFTSVSVLNLRRISKKLIVFGNRSANFAFQMKDVELKFQSLNAIRVLSFVMIKTSLNL